MFGHLDDASPPEANAKALAAIFARSAALRRRRSRMVFGAFGSGVLAFGIVIGFLIPRAPSPIRVTNLSSQSGTLSPGLPIPTSQLVDSVFPDNEHGFALTSGPGRAALVGTADGGRTWTVISGTLPVSSAAQLDFTNTTDGYLWGGPPTSGGALPLWVTDDGGRGWARAPIGPVVSDVSSIGQDVWAVVGTCPITSTLEAPSCPVVLDISTDGGATWSPSTTEPPLDESSAPSYSDQDVELARMTLAHAYVLSFDPAGASAALDRLAYTANGGQSWAVRPDPCTQALPYGEISGSGTDDLWLLCAAAPGGGSQIKSLYRSYDGGMTWALISSTGNPPTPKVGAIPLVGYVAPVSLGHDNLAVLSSTEAWLFPGRGLVYETTDGGQTWREVRSLIASGFSSVGTSGNVVFSSATSGWVDEPGVGLWHTTNASSWHELGS